MAEAFDNDGLDLSFIADIRCTSASLLRGCSCTTFLPCSFCSATPLCQRALSSLAGSSRFTCIFQSHFSTCTSSLCLPSLDVHTDSVESYRSSYELDNEGNPQPLSYAQLRPSLPPSTQRLVVFPISPAADLLQEAVKATEDVIDHGLPPGELSCQWAATCPLEVLM